MKIEILNGQTIGIVPVAHSRTRHGADLLLGKVVITGRFVLWYKNVSNPQHPFWMYMCTGFEQDLKDTIVKMCGSIELEPSPR